MKIAMIGAWNTGSGASIHAELIGREWVKKGAELSVFSFYDHSFHGKVFTTPPDREEKYVTRCFTKYGDPAPKLDPAGILKGDFDIFVVQDLGMLPIGQLLPIFPEIRKKSRTVNIIHDGEISTKPDFFDFRWDSVVCFDNRYYDFLKKVYPEDIISIIPYPAFPLTKGSRLEARQKLGLTLSKKIVFIFGQAAEHAAEIESVLNKLNNRYDILLVVVAKVEKTLKRFENIKPKTAFDISIIEEAPDMARLYDYLHAADCTVYNKRPISAVVVASTVFQCMGSGCPILALNSNFVHAFKDEVIRYQDDESLEKSIIDVFKEGDKYRKQQKAVEVYLKTNSSEHIAEKFLDLFVKLLKDRRRENVPKKV